MSDTISAPTAEQVQAALRVPFRSKEVGWKPQAVKGNRAMAIAYIDARNVMDRLDEVVGLGNWRDDYTVLPGDSVVCQLSVRVAGEWVPKTDVGSPSEQPDGGDRMKAAFSDALKRAAVKFGIGRYLYELPNTWADYDPAKKAFVQPPRLPDWALHPSERAGAGKPKAAPAQQPAQAATKPATGEELHRRLRAADADLAARGICQAGALLAHVTQVGVKAGYGADLATWGGPAIELAIAETTAFKARLSRPGDRLAPPAKLPRQTQDQVRQAIHGFRVKVDGQQIEASWHHPKCKARFGEIIGRPIGEAEGIEDLGLAEAKKLIDALHAAREQKGAAA